MAPASAAITSRCGSSEWHTRHKSTPASRPSTAQLPTPPGKERSAPISMSSDIITFRNPNRFRSAPTTLREHDAGGSVGPFFSSPPLVLAAVSPAPCSIPGTTRCATKIDATPAAMASRNGGISTARRRSYVCAIVGNESCESPALSPCPGQCFAHAATPFFWSARMNADATSPTLFVSLPKLRSPITIFKGLVFTSTTGAKVMSTFTARSSLPMTSPVVCAATTGSNAFPTSCAEGICVKWLFSLNRATRPPSWSTITKSLRGWARRFMDAHSVAT
mmetsp:Transcript_6097/g.20313  ORF Transcript_6097/g.20313 Transcript_6097/m.20313 type:complete len:277 (-) Transcript_6097:168-998(-)